MVWEPGCAQFSVCVCVKKRESSNHPFKPSICQCCCRCVAKNKTCHLTVFATMSSSGWGVKRVVATGVCFFCVCMCVFLYAVCFLAGSISAYVPPLSMQPTSFSSVPVCFQRRSGSTEFLQQWLSNQRPILSNHSLCWHVRASYDCLTSSSMTGLIERSRGVEASLIYWFM